MRGKIIEAILSIIVTALACSMAVVIYFNGPFMTPSVKTFESELNRGVFVGVFGMLAVICIIVAIRVWFVRVRPSRIW